MVSISSQQQCTVAFKFLLWFIFFTAMCMAFYEFIKNQTVGAAFLKNNHT